jgi:hypothetical protein
VASDQIETGTPDGTRHPALSASLGQHLARAFHDPAERDT